MRQLLCFALPQHFLGGLFRISFLSSFTMTDARRFQINVLNQMFSESCTALNENETQIMLISCSCRKYIDYETFIYQTYRFFECEERPWRRCRWCWSWSCPAKWTRNLRTEMIQGCRYFLPQDGDVEPLFLCCFGETFSGSDRSRTSLERGWEVERRSRSQTICWE